MDSDEINDSPVEQVRLTVPITDDSTLPTITFRTWLLGPITCAFLAFVNEFSSYRQVVFFFPPTFVIIMLGLVGKLMAALLPSTLIKVPGIKWSFTLNPGPFNVKEHVVLSILANSGINGIPTDILIIRKVFYQMNTSFFPIILVCLTVQLMGYGFAGLFSKLLVNSPYMWYPLVLSDVSFYRTLHEGEEFIRPKGGVTKFQFFIISTIISFAYYIVPGYFFPSIAALSFVCWVWKNSVIAQLIGSGRNGFGIGSFTLDWASISFIGNPLVLPLSTIINIMVGFILFYYVVAPLAYWFNLYNAQRFPLSSNTLYQYNGQAYNVSRIINEQDLTFNQEKYDNYSKIYLSVVYLFNIGFALASITAILSHFCLFHGRETWKQFKQAFNNSNRVGDVHNRLMTKYDPVPQWWFLAILVSMAGLAIFTCQIYKNDLQLPYWGILLSCALMFIFLLPLAILQATTGQFIALNIFSEMLFGYIYPGRPIGLLVFKHYIIGNEFQALGLISELKLAHYMKIPPKTMFVAQLAGTLVATFIPLGTCWWIVSSIENICDPKRLPKGSPWTCPGFTIGYGSSAIWGVIGPSRVFFPNGLYSNLYWFLFFGFFATVFVWVLLKSFPQKKWLNSINVPNILSAISSWPVASAANYWSWSAVGILYNVFVYRRYKKWWSTYNYALANALDIGVAILGTLTMLTLGVGGVYGVNWWGLEVGDHCPLATCPMAEGVSVDGCPIF